MELYNNTFDKENFTGYWPLDKKIPFFSDESTANYQYRQLLIQDWIGTVPTIFIQKQVFKNVGFYDEQFKHIEDYPYWLKLTKNGVKLFFMDIPTVKYRKHDASIHNNFKRNLIQSAYFKNEPLRKKYIYPYLSKKDFIYQKYCYYWAFFFKLISKNRYNWVLSRLYNLVTLKSRIFNLIKQRKL
jgi:hypothetical protein